MLQKVTSSFIILMLLVIGTSQAQDKRIERNIITFNKIIVDPDYVPDQYTKLDLTPPVYRGDAMDIGVTTWYDYFSNSVVRDQIVYFDGVTHFANMVRPWGGNTGRRVVAYVTYDGTNFTAPIAVFDTSKNSGWPQIDIAMTSGDILGTVGIVGHHATAPTTPSKLALYDGAGGFLVSQFDPSTDPSLQFTGNNIYLASSGGRVQFKFYRTTDLGVTFELFDSISAWHPSPIWWSENGGVEVGMSKSQDEQTIVYFGTNTGVGHVYEGIGRDSADNFWRIYSTNAGSTWNGEMFGWDGDFSMVPSYKPWGDTSVYTPLFENFGQVDMAVGNNGVFHAVANGYGIVWGTGTGDTLDFANSFPVLYWNSNSNEWKTLSDIAIDTIQAIGNYYPTNSIGQAYPSVSVSEDGQVVYVIWTGPQLTATGELDLGNNGAGTMYYWRDLYHAFSTDGGTTWEYLGVFPDMQTNASEIFATAAQHLEFIPPNIYRAHIVYISDLTTGVAPFDNQFTDNPIMYATYDMIGTSVDDQIGTVNKFDLAQNYPNPFNPSTKISYTLAEKSNVTLKVYDVLGNEVATLVNTNQDAGQHDVTFNASNLASGLYIYTLKAGEFTSSKKMMLLK